MPQFDPKSAFTTRLTLPCYAIEKGRADMRNRNYNLRCFYSTFFWTCFLFIGIGESQAHEITLESFIDRYCIECHHAAKPSSGIALPEIDLKDVRKNSDMWERVVRKLAARQMPPQDSERPSEADYEHSLEQLTRALDREALEHPQPGRTASLRRMNRTEYRNAIRDLLALDVDVEQLLPPDESSGGFDNVTVTDLSPTLLNRYITAAQKISRLAIGNPLPAPVGDTIRIPADQTQEEHVAGLPIGTRGGAIIPYTFPQTGEYEIQIRLARDRNEEVEGLRERHELQILLDRELMANFEVKPPKDGNHSVVDSHLVARVQATAGPHQVGVTFVKKPKALLETKREPYAAHFNMHRHPRLSPAIYQISIAGPFAKEQGVATEIETPSRKRILISRPKSSADEANSAQQILSQLIRRAYRRPVQSDDLDQPMKFYTAARETGNFEAGIEAALSAVLVNPNFLLRIERDPAQIAPNTAYPISDIELASRLSFFLWSSLPDDELLELAERGTLHQPKVLEAQTRRMLADPRSSNLINNFASQWLYLRNLDSITPDLRLFPDFDDNLRQSFRRETELFVESVLREDRSVTDLLDAKYTFLNERLAKHYGIPHIYGSRFRRVQLDPTSHRGGLLRHGSILTVTSYATRTSPVIRGHWILKNLIGAPPAPPPPDVPALKDNTVSASLPIKERLAEHRAQAACASCHNLMDPIGFALENYDAVGRWRDTELGQPIDASGQMLGGVEFDGVTELEQTLAKRPDLFASTLSERLLMFAIGRSLTHADAPAVRKIVAQANSHLAISHPANSHPANAPRGADATHDRAQEYRFSSLIVGITQSTPFLMRTSE